MDEARGGLEACSLFVCFLNGCSEMHSGAFYIISLFFLYISMSYAYKSKKWGVAAPLLPEILLALANSWSVMEKCSYRLLNTDLEVQPP